MIKIQCEEPFPLKLFAAHKFRNEGDAARDSKSWGEAAAAYKHHLMDRPTDAEIWVQLGHALKEQEIFGEAEDAYRNAITLRPDDADSSLHLAHLLKRSGRVSEAAEMFAVSFKSLPSGDAYNELKRLRGAVPFGSIENDIAAGTVFIEIDDLFRYLDAHRTLSGIQRLQVEMIQHVLASRDQDKSSVFVINTEDADGPALGDSGCMWHLQDAHLLELANYVTGAHVDHAYLRQIIERAKNGASLTAPRTGQTYLVLGSFWGSIEATRRYLALKRSGIPGRQTPEGRLCDRKNSP
jgi:tetratricopeptide (TPR) repeat protein